MGKQIASPAERFQMSYVSSKMARACGQMNAMFNEVADARQAYADAQLAMAEAYALLDVAFKNLNRAETHLEYAVDDFRDVCNDEQIDED